MKIGTIVIYKGQQYELEGFIPHVRRDGSHTKLAIIRSHCKRCGDPFTFTAATKGDEPIFHFVRRCKRHTTRRPK